MRSGELLFKASVKEEKEVDGSEKTFVKENHILKPKKGGCEGTYNEAVNLDFETFAGDKSKRRGWENLCGSSALPG